MSNPNPNPNARLARVASQLNPRPVHASSTQMYPGRVGPAPKVNIAMVPPSPAGNTLKGKTVFISGGSRGIGLACIERAARDGANVCIAAKTVVAHPNLPGTIHTAAERVRELGGRALAVQCDIRSEEAVQRAVDACVKEFGGIDVLINNASAISLTPIAQTTLKKYDLMNQVNARGTFLCTKLCMPHLKKSRNGHIITMSPPLNLEERWFAPHGAYSIAKYSMSLITGLAAAGELREDGVAANCLWPLTTIATAAVNNLLGGDAMMRTSRTPEIMADAFHAIVTRDSRSFTGQFCVDETVLRELGVTDFGRYAVVPGTKDSELTPDFFV